MKTAKEILYEHCSMRSSFWYPEEAYILKAMEEYKNQSVKALELVIETKEKERKEWADLCVKQIERVNELKMILEGYEK